MDEHQTAAETFEKALELTKELESKDAQRAVEKVILINWNDFGCVSSLWLEKNTQRRNWI